MTDDQKIYILDLDFSHIIFKFWKKINLIDSLKKLNKNLRALCDFFPTINIGVERTRKLHVGFEITFNPSIDSDTVDSLGS